jgi:drug/metabolite transporter (DMT)-like permease
VPKPDAERIDGLARGFLPPEAFALAIASAVCHALWNLAARRVSGDLVVLWLGFGAAAILVFPFAAGMWIRSDSGAELSLESVQFMLISGAVHSVYTLLLSAAYRRGEISVVYPVARGSGVAMTAVLGFLFFGERMSQAGVGGISLVLIATLCFGVPALRSAGSRHGYLFALGVGCTIAIYSLVDKAGVTLVHPVLYIWAMFTISFVFLWPVVVRRNVGEQIHHRARRLWRYVGVVGTGYLVSYLLMLFALTLGPVSYLVASRESSVALGAALGIIFLGERFTKAKALAIVLMTGGLACLRFGSW